MTHTIIPSDKQHHTHTRKHHTIVLPTSSQYVLPNTHPNTAMSVPLWNFISLSLSRALSNHTLTAIYHHQTYPILIL